MSKSEEPSSKKNGPPSIASQVLDSRILILGIQFLVTGALGLPLLWFSPAFSRKEKWVWSIIVTVYTALLLFGTAAICWWSWSVISQHL